MIGFPSVNGARPRRVPAAERPHENAVDNRQFSFQDSRLPQDCQDVHMQSLPDPAGIPPLKAAMSCSSRASEFQGTPSQRHPVTSTNQIIFTTIRCSIGGLSPQFPIGFSEGWNSDDSSKNSSGIRASAIMALSKVHVDLEGSLAKRMPNQVL